MADKTEKEREREREREVSVIDCGWRLCVFRDAASVFQSVRRDSRVYGDEGPGHKEITVGTH